MANEVLWVAGTSSVIINGSASDGDTNLSSEFDNSANKDRFCGLEIEADPDAAPVEDTALYLWFLYAPDGVNYPTYTADEMYNKVPDVIVSADDVATNQRWCPVNIPIDPYKLKVLTCNKLGQGIDIVVTIFTYNEEIQ